MTRTIPTRFATRAKRKKLMTGLLVATALTATAPVASHADPVACVTLYYTINGSARNYIVNDCFVPSPWSAKAGDGPGCTSYVGNPATVYVCHDVSLSFPVP